MGKAPLDRPRVRRKGPAWHGCSSGDPDIDWNVVGTDQNRYQRLVRYGRIPKPGRRTTHRRRVQPDGWSHLETRWPADHL